jgi:hypothetical protein
MLPNSLRQALIENLDKLGQEAEHKSGERQALADHFANVYKVSMHLAA